MSDPVNASILIETCDPECPCQKVHLFLRDVDGNAYAGAVLTPQIAREIADHLHKCADVSDARKLRNRGRLA